MSTTEPKLPPFVINTGLFHDHFLLASLVPTLPLHPDEVTKTHTVTDARHDADLILAQIQSLWDERHTQLTINEATVEDFVADICCILGMTVSRQGSIPREGTTAQRVDLTLFTDNDAANDFAERTTQQQHANERYAYALAVVEVKQVGKPFDRGASRDKPYQQLVGYLTHTGVSWGILTDGHRWRIYRRFDTPSYKYIEINLATILTEEDETAQREMFWWFYTVFHRDAFNFHERKARLDALYASSQSHALGEQDSLRHQAFRVVEELARGIYATHASPNTTDLTHIYQQAIVILYRLLFLKFAEDKELLPVHHPMYVQAYGYRSVEEGLLATLDTPTMHLGTSAASSTYWNRLQHLFQQLNVGNHDIGIFPYNGGLFGDTYIGTTPLCIAEVTIPDSFLAQAIAHLARISYKGTQLRVNYRTLQPRHLGSIYEGLLEQHLERQADTVHLVSTAGEQSNQRRTSGSYYTPEYIVQYIVVNTIDPLCTGKTAKEIAHIQVLDPSMGSGHFLVTALYRLAQHHAQAKKREAMKPPVRVPMESDAQFAERNRAYVAHIAPTEEDIDRSQQELVEHCIYGVDLNPLAVELAKVALWLSTLAQDRPLSFLNHHLRVGNSLVGASMEHVGSLATMSANGNGNGKKNNGKKNNGNGNGNSNGTVYQMGLFEQIVWRVRDTILSYFQQIVDVPSITPDQIHQKEQAYAHFRAFSKPFRQVANLWVSSYFGNGFTSQQAVDVLEAVDDCYANPPDRTKWDVMETQPWFLRAQEIADTKGYRFFHWELEFPQIFLREEKGFDVVIGNPPYLVMENMTSDDRNFYYSKLANGQSLYKSATSKANVYAIFWERSLYLYKLDGKIAFITPYSWLSNSSFLKLRQLFLDTSYIEEINLFPVGVFEEAGIATSITIVQNKLIHSGYEIKVRDLRSVSLKELPSKIQSEFSRIPVDTIKQNAGNIFHVDWNSLQANVINAIRKYGVFLENICFVDRGCDTANNERYTGYTFVPSLNPKKLLVGENFQRYSFSWDGLYLYYLPEEMKKENSTARPGSPERFERDGKIILYRFLSKTKQFVAVVENEQYYSLGSTYVLSLKPSVKVELNYILTVINSWLISVYNKIFFTGVKITLNELYHLPIRRIHFTTPAQERNQRGNELLAQVKTATNAHAPLEPLQDVAAFRASELGQVFVVLLPMDETGQFLAFHDGATGAEEYSDVVHDVLAHLAQRMIDLNQQRHQQQTDMLTDIQGVMGQPVWESLGKKRQLWNPRAKKAQTEKKAKQTLGPLYDEILTIENALGRITRDQFAWLLGYKLGTVDNLSKLLKIYDQYHSAIVALNHQITATDALIDQIVYLLYGLTAEEVAVIELPKGTTI